MKKHGLHNKSESGKIDLSFIEEEVYFEKYDAILFLIAKSYGLNHIHAEQLINEIHSSLKRNNQLGNNINSLRLFMIKNMLQKCVAFISNHICESNDGLQNISLNYPLNYKYAIHYDMPLTLRTVYILYNIVMLKPCDIAMVLNLGEHEVKERINRTVFFIKNYE